MTNDVLIIGGGIIGLAIAIELKLRGASVIVVSRSFSAAATHAAAGMLAPNAEKIPEGAMYDLCQRSLFLYHHWTHKIEEFTGLNTGFSPCGVLAPVYEEEAVRGCGGDGESNSSFPPAPQPPIPHSSSPAYWLDREAIHQHQPGMSVEVAGGWWYPEDAQVDNRTLAQALLIAAKSLGVEIKEGITVEGIGQQQRQVIGVQTNAGVIRAEHYVLAAGAWSNKLLPLPLRAIKGQMLSVRLPESEPELPLAQVLYGQDIYIVPRRDRQIIIGATSEDVGFTPHNTPKGIQTLLQRAIRLYPQLQDYPIQELWWGFRPTTPDELPILGTSHCKNLTFATGHYRNGILLAPITATLIADLIWEQKSDPLLTQFNYSRFHDRHLPQRREPPQGSVLTKPSTATPMLTSSPPLPLSPFPTHHSRSLAKPLRVA